MVRITEDLLRKRAEHNNCELFSLEEISIHQLEIERIELLDKLCRDLKIVYLQSNLVPKIENVGRLKKLEYINLALNNVTRIENLEGCESLNKLDLTVNFVAELTSINSLKGNIHLKELFLTGNPCTDYEGYRPYVIATLTQLKWLDGVEIEKSERILALQEYQTISEKIKQQEAENERSKDKEQEDKEDKAKADEILKENRTKNWYTDIGNPEKKNENSQQEDDEAEKRFWEEKVEYTPESRIQVHKHIEEKRKRQEQRDKERLEGPAKPERETRFFAEDGRVLNLNQGKWDFHLKDDEENNEFMLDLPCYKHVDTSLIDVDVQPTYVRATIKGKAFQIALSEEVNPDSSSAKRSQTTGHLLITMPKMKQTVKPLKTVIYNKTKQTAGKKMESQNKSSANQQRVTHERLDVDHKANKEMDFSKIVQNKKTPAGPLGRASKQHTNTALPEEENDKDFVDDPDVPPLM